jgi:hypothetical protein
MLRVDPWLNSLASELLVLLLDADHGVVLLSSLVKWRDAACV